MTTLVISSSPYLSRSLRYFILHTVILLMSCAFAAQAQVTRYTYHGAEEQQLKEVYQVRDTIDNVLEGQYISYYLNGNIESKGQFSNNETVGSWQFYYETGKLKMKGTLKPSSNDGFWEYYYENGNKSMEGDISNNKRRGEWKIYYESGELKEQGLFRDNKREGLWVYYYEDGKVKGEINYSFGKGQMTEFYPTGEKRAMGPKSDTKSVGEWHYYYKDGALQAEGMYENSRKTAEWTYYHHNGNISAVGEFGMGSPEGDWKYYYEDGKLRSEGKFVNGEKSGYWGVFYKNGELKGETTFENGRGTYREYYLSGELKIKGPVVDGKSHGLWQYFYEDGKLEGECKFEHGRGTYYGYYPDGTLQTKGEIENGQKVGKWELYDRDGSLSGYYNPVYEEYGIDKEVITEVAKPKREYGVADYRFKGRKVKYFKAKINEFQGVILGFNPLMSFLGRVPFDVEFYMQERLGHEFEFEGLRSPFYTNDDDVPLNDTFDRGYSIALKQKFYNVAASKFGLWYFGHEIRFTNLSHYANVESTVVPDNEIKVSASEQKLEYSLLLGYRLMQNTDAKGWSIDSYVSVGTGYRSFSAAEEYKEAFDDLKQGPVTFRLSFGLNFGYTISFGRRGR